VLRAAQELLTKVARSLHSGNEKNELSGGFKRWFGREWSGAMSIE
jgi:hypothetical protein